MRLVDMQVSVNATATGGDQYGQLQSAGVYRFFHDIEQARKTNLKRQESALPVSLTFASLPPIQDQKTSPTYTNRVKRDQHESKKEDHDSKPEYGNLSKTHDEMPVYIDFSA